MKEKKELVTMKVTPKALSNFKMSAGKNNKFAYQSAEEASELLVQRDNKIKKTK